MKPVRACVAGTVLVATVILIAGCSTPAPSQPSTSKTIDPTRKECELAQDRMFDIAIELDRIEERINSSISYGEMARLAKSNAWDATLIRMQSELSEISLDDVSTDGVSTDQPAGLRFAKHLLTQALAEELRGVRGLLRLKPAERFDAPEETRFALTRGAELLEESSKELGAVHCLDP